MVGKVARLATVFDADAIKVTIGGHVVEVCCEECARTLKAQGFRCTGGGLIR